MKRHVRLCWLSSPRYVGYMETTLPMKTISLQEAKAQGLSRYFTGEPCKRGHIAERTVGARRCVECNRQQVRAHYAENGEAVRAKNRSNGSQHRSKCKSFGITEEAYAQMLAQQGGVCAICSSDPGDKRLAIDHCHTTGKVRGLLCAECNHGIGKFRDSLTLLERAHGYLASSGAHQD